MNNYYAHILALNTCQTLKRNLNYFSLFIQYKTHIHIHWSDKSLDKCWPQFLIVWKLRAYGLFPLLTMYIHNVWLCVSVSFIWIGVKNAWPFNLRHHIFSIPKTVDILLGLRNFFFHWYHFCVHSFSWMHISKLLWFKRNDNLWLAILIQRTLNLNLIWNFVTISESIKCKHNKIWHRNLEINQTNRATAKHMIF